MENGAGTGTTMFGSAICEAEEESERGSEPSV